MIELTRRSCLHTRLEIRSKRSQEKKRKKQRQKVMKFERTQLSHLKPEIPSHFSG